MTHAARHDHGLSAPSRNSVVVVGGGFCGTMVAANLLRASRDTGLALDVHLVDRRGIVGQGVAYGTREAVHLLNVPASGMSAWPDRPDDFLEWVRARHPGTPAYAFLPRRDYGDYMRETLQREAGAESGARLHVHADEVRSLVPELSNRWLTHFAGGASIACDAVVLATGQHAPGDPFAGRWSGPRHRCIADPWQPLAVAGIGPEEPVAIIGAGLSAIDVTLSLTSAAAPRTAPILLLSRSGRMPRSHAAMPVKPAPLGECVARWSGVHGRATLRALLRALRQQMALVQDGARRDWREVIDGLRPHTQGIWGRLDHDERLRFMRHLRGLWDAHRHRTAPQVASRLVDLERAGRFQVLRARLLQASAQGDHVHLSADIRDEAGSVQRRNFDVSWVVNCSGPTPSSAPSADPAVSSLCAAGLARPDALALGLETDGEGRAVDAQGGVRDDLVVVGALRRARLWESTAVPELRVQAAAAARTVLGFLKARRGIAST